MSEKKLTAAQAYEKFGRYCAGEICDGDNWFSDLDGVDAGDKLLEFGILVEEKYDPDAHGEIYFAHDPEPGDEVQVFAEGMRPTDLAPPAHDALVAACKAMIDLEARRMYERDPNPDARVRPCSCQGCNQLRTALKEAGEL
jgi:hypothetical protein